MTQVRETRIELGVKSVFFSLFVLFCFVYERVDVTSRLNKKLKGKKELCGCMVVVCSE